MSNRSKLALAAAVLWAAGWAAGTWNAVMRLLGFIPDIEYNPSWIKTVYDAISGAANAALLVFCVYLCVKYLAKVSFKDAGLAFPTTRAAWKSTLTVAVLYVLIQVVGKVAQFLPSLLTGGGPSGYPTPETASLVWQVPLAFSSVFEAGPTEELVLVVAIPLLLLAARVPWRAVLAIAMIARVSFHLYYGWLAVPGLVLWAFLAILLWRVWPSAWGLALGHAISNGLSVPGVLNLPTAAVTTAGVVLVALVIWGGFILVRNFLGHWAQLQASGNFRNTDLDTSKNATKFRWDGNKKLAR
ncbi:hypothetical protein [Paeniglutamicibacter sp. NPDC091659]|uniref:hypothetical protein n=1 Tax=Paeniglutamicibacter sp. NPDC091659 TaxID=3364389 RepID=UPI003815F6A3